MGRDAGDRAGRGKNEPHETQREEKKSNMPLPPKVRDSLLLEHYLSTMGNGGGLKDASVDQRKHELFYQGSDYVVRVH